MKNQKINFEFFETGFDRYFAEHGHYPIVHVIDECTYLPSSHHYQFSLRLGPTKTPTFR